MTSEEARNYLEFELQNRVRRNPRYSLRTYARQLGVSHTLLSLILSKKRNVSAKLILKLGDPIAPTSATHKNISLTQFEQISNWYHFAILALLEIPGFKLEAKWISQRLNISTLQAHLAISTLRRMKLIKKNGGRWIQSTKPLVVDNTTSISVTRSYHKEILAKAVESLFRDPLFLRDFSGTSFAIDPKQIPFAIKKIRHFRRALVKELESLGTPSEVYHISVQLFPLTRT